jgi:Protein of unknown function (DUF2911)
MANNTKFPPIGTSMLAVMLATATGVSWAGAQPALPPVLPRTNPQAVVKQRIGVTDVEITYNRPSVKGRAVFGGLVPFGQVWRTGADEATTIRFSTDVTVNGAAVPAGTYELFTIPGESAWTVIVHRHRSHWGSYAYDSANDVARATVTPVVLTTPVESFTISVDDVGANQAVMHLSWDRTRVPVAIGVDVVGLTVPRIEEAMRRQGKKPYFTAAMFYFENSLDVHKAAEWMAAALAESPGHIGMLYRQALILDKAGDHDGAIRAATASLAGAATSGRELREEYTRLNTELLGRLRASPK